MKDRRRSWLGLGVLEKETVGAGGCVVMAVPFIELIASQPMTSSSRKREDRVSTTVLFPESACKATGGSP